MIGNLLWFEFQGHKGQKGHYDRQKLQIAILQLYESKFGLPTLLMLNINALHPIQNRINKNDNFRAQYASQLGENWILAKNGIEYLQCIFLLPFFYIYAIF